MEIKDIMENDLKEADKDVHTEPAYISKEGFEKVKIIRGFTEIKSVFNAIQDLGIICGGYVRYCCSPQLKPIPAGDLDVYPYTKESFDKIKEKFKSLEIKHENEMCITYKQATEGDFTYTPTIQLIKPVLEGSVVAVGDMETILKNFDFTVVRAAIVSETEALVDADFIHDEQRRLLRVKNIHCPISSTLRCMKYANKGYWLRPMQALKLFLDWEGRDQAYRDKIVSHLEKADKGEGLTEEDINELEKLMRID